MTVNIHEEVNHLFNKTSGSTTLDNLIQGYVLCARSEGKSAKTIQIMTTDTVNSVSSRVFYHRNQRSQLDI